MLSGTYRVMYPFKDIANDDAALAHCPVLRAALVTFEFIDTHGPIELTPSKALMGHSSIQTTALYCQVSDEQLRNAANAGL